MRTSVKISTETSSLLRTLAAQLTIAEGRQISMGEAVGAAARLASKDVDATRQYLTGTEPAAE